MAPLTCLEMFAGGGGLALGLEQAGFVHQAAVELDPRACEILRVNRPAWTIIEGDVRDMNGGAFADIDLFCGGMPSLERRANEDRDLFPEMLRLVAEIAPRAVLLECTRELATSRFAGFRDQVMTRFGELGYESWLRVVHASDHGVPQPRPRCVLVAIRPPWFRHFKWPEPSSVPLPIGEVLYDLMSERGWRGAGAWRDHARRIAPTIVSGSTQGGPDLGPTRARQAWAALGIDGRGIADEPPGPDFPSGQLPRLTVRMVARLQGFPDDWVFTGRKQPHTARSAALFHRQWRGFSGMRSAARWTLSARKDDTDSVPSTQGDGNRAPAPWLGPSGTRKLRRSWRAPLPQIPPG